MHVAFSDLKKCVDGGGGGDATLLMKPVSEIHSLILGGGGEMQGTALTKDGCDGDLQPVLLAVDAPAMLVKTVKETQQVESEIMVLAIGVLVEILSLSRDLCHSFITAGGVDVLQLDHDIEEVSRLSFAAAAALAKKNEQGKSVIMALDVSAKIQRALERIERAEQKAEFVDSVASLVLSLTSADDDSQPSSRCDVFFLVGVWLHHM